MPGTRCAVALYSNSLKVTKKNIKTFHTIHFQKIKNYVMFGKMPIGGKISGISKPVQFVVCIFMMMILKLI